MGSIYVACVLSEKVPHMGIWGEGPLRNSIIGHKYPILIVKGDKKTQRIEKFYLKAVWKECLKAGQTLN